MKNNKTVSIYTLGCKVNQYDSEAIKEDFIDSGYNIVKFNQKADVYIINTCTITHMSDRKSRQMIRRTKRTNPNAITIVMGCYPQTAQEVIEEIEEVDLIIGTNQRKNIVNIVEKYKAGNTTTNYIEDIMKVDEFEELEINTMKKRTRAYLKIQEGCNNYCSYCIIPYARGNIRSRQPENVIAEVKRLAKDGFKEIVLTGIHVASYGKDLNNIKLTDIIKKVHSVKGIERIRLSSIEPNVITKEFIEELSKLNKICHHFHLSLQSGSDGVLKRMNRKYTSEHYKQAVSRLRETFDDIGITTDIIVGFPGETKEEFQETIDFVKEIEFSQVHIFPYSARTGTLAANMDNQIDPKVKEQRVERLTQVTDKLEKEFLESHIGKIVEVLFESNNKNNRYNGYTSNYLRTQVTSKEDLSNQIKSVKIIKVKNTTLWAEVINCCEK